MKIQSYQCDECGVQKQESNHWVIGFISSCGEIKFSRWPEEEPSGNYANIKHLCGAGCAGKVLDRQIAKWKEK